MSKSGFIFQLAADIQAGIMISSDGRGIRDDSSAIRTNIPVYPI